MRNTRLGLALTVLLLTALAPSDAASNGQLLDQKVTADNVAAEISVMPSGGNDYTIEAHFESSSYPVGCLSVYRDLHYQLRDTNGHIIAVNQQTLAHPPYEGQVYNHVRSSMVGKPPGPCEQNAPGGAWNARAFLSDLYPNLPPGKYTLQISFAPPRIAQHAYLTPVQITIAPTPQPSI